MDLLAKEDLRTRLVIESTVTDAVLDHIIGSVSAQVEDFLGRQIEIAAITETFSVDDGQEFWLLKAYPNITVTSLKHDLEWGFGTDISELSSSAYTVDEEAGILHVTDGYLNEGFNVLQIVYQGGIAATLKDLKADVAGRVIFEAALKQCSYVYKTRKRQGASSVNPGIGGVTYDPDQGLQTAVRNMLRPHSRGPTSG
jgi:hypothetical protein